MPEHYAVMTIDAGMNAVMQSVRTMRSPLDGFIQEISLNAGAAIPGGAGDAVLDVNKNGATIFPVPANRPKVVAGASSGAVLGLAVAIAKGDLITIDLDQYPLGGVPVPLSIRMTLFDTIALRSTIIYVTGVLADGATENASIPNMGRGWILLAADADHANWARFYNKATKRTADASRTIDTDADENAGVCGELIFTASALSLAWSSPYPTGFNLDDAQSTSAIAAIKNTSGGSTAIQLTLQRLVIER